METLATIRDVARNFCLEGPSYARCILHNDSSVKSQQSRVVTTSELSECVRKKPTSHSGLDHWTLVASYALARIFGFEGI